MLKPGDLVEPYEYGGTMLYSDFTIVRGVTPWIALQEILPWELTNRALVLGILGPSHRYHQVTNVIALLVTIGPTIVYTWESRVKVIHSI